MSDENLQIARRAYDAFNRRDISGWLSLHSADAAMYDLPSLPDGEVHRGLEEMRKWAEGVLETTQYLRLEPHRFVDKGEFVLVPLRVSAKGRGSGAPTEMSVVHVLELREGKIRRLWNYADEADALRALGVAE